MLRLLVKIHLRPLTSIGRCWPYVVPLKGEPADPDCQFQAQEGNRIVGLFMRDGKPMGIIVALVQAIGCLKKCFGNLGDRLCARNRNMYNNTVDHILIVFAEM